MRILLAIDDSRFSQAAIETVIEQARPQDTDVRILHVVESPPLLVAREWEDMSRPTKRRWNLRNRMLRPWS